MQERRLSFVVVFFLLIFRLPAGLCSEQLTLSSALDKISQHPLAKIDQLDLKKAEETIAQARSRLFPSLELADTQTSPRSLKDFDNEVFSTTANLNLLNAFRDTLAIKSAKLQGEEQKQIYIALKIKRQLNVSELFFECLHAKKSVELAKKAYEGSLGIAKIAKKRFERGTNSQDDFLKLQVEADSLSVRWLNEQEKHDLCLASLSYWVGNFSELVDPNIVGKLKPSSTSPELHPNVIAAQQSLKLAEIAKRSVTLKYFLNPRVDLTYSDLHDKTTSTQSGTWLLTAKLDIFSSTGSYKDIPLAMIDVQKANENLNNVKRSVIKSQISERHSLQKSLAQYLILEKNLETIKKSFRTSLRRFQAGAITANDVAQDQARVISATFAVNDMWLKKYQSWLKHLASLGQEISAFLPSKN